MLTNWRILVAEIGALLIAIFGALFLTDYKVNEYALSNLKTDTVWISNPENMNDPFDSGIHFISETDRKSVV